MNIFSKYSKIFIKYLLSISIDIGIKIFQIQLRNYSKKKIIIFMFHEISNNPSSYQIEKSLNIKIETFIKQIDFIKNNFNIINPKDLLINKIPDNAALISFDDGFYGSINNAVPILEDKKIHSIHFLNSDSLYKKINIGGLQSFIKKNRHIVKKYSILGKDNLSFNYNEKIHDIFDQKDFQKITNYTGRFITQTELLQFVEKYKYFYIGNHLSNHYNSIKIGKENLLKSYNICNYELSKYKNYLNFFSYPYGQNNIHYNKITNDFIKKKLSNFIFSANPINYNIHSSILHRLPLFDNIDSEKNFFTHILIRNILEKIKMK